SNLQRFACSAFRNECSDSPKAGRVRHDHQTGAGNSFIAKSIVSPEGRSAYRERPFQSHLFSIASQRITSDRPEGSMPLIYDEIKNLIPFRATQSARPRCVAGTNNKSRRKTEMADQGLDARRIAREQESRIASASAYCMNAAKPMIQCQASMLRLWADNMEM